MRATENPEAYARAIEAYCAGMAEGKPSAELLKATGLSHAQAGLAWYEDARNPMGIMRGANKGATDAEIVLMRAGTHPDYEGRKLSWGYIMVATDQGEDKVRAQFGRAAKVAAEGTRIGKGGAYLDNDARFYAGARKHIGIEAEAPKAIADPERTKLANEAIQHPELVKPKVQAVANSLKGKAKQRARKAATARAEQAKA